MSVDHQVVLDSKFKKRAAFLLFLRRSKTMRQYCSRCLALLKLVMKSTVQEKLLPFDSYAQQKGEIVIIVFCVWFGTD